MAKIHSRKDPSLWRGPGKIEYRNSTAGMKKKKRGIKNKTTLLIYIYRGHLG